MNPRKFPWMALCFSLSLILVACSPTTAAPMATPIRADAPPTNTPVPPTPTDTRVPPTATATNTDVLFTDDYSGSCSLLEGDNEERTFKCENGEYTMLNKINSARWVFYPGDYDDFMMEADAHVMSSPAFIEYGLVFRITKDGRGFYGFTLTRDGKFSVFRYQDKIINLIPFTAASSIKTNTAINHLKVIVRGNQIAVYVNDQWLDTATDPTFKIGSFGFFLNNQAPHARVAFDNLRVSRVASLIEIPTRIPPTATRVPPTRTLVPSTPTSIPPTATPDKCSPPPGKAGFLIQNYYGKEMSFSIAGHDYKVPPSPGPSLPGELCIVLDPGMYTYSANIPDIGEAVRTIELQANRIEIQPWGATGIK